MNDIEEQFIKEIEKNKTDDTAKLIYADWLEERGNFEAEAMVHTIFDQLQNGKPPEKKLTYISVHGENMKVLLQKLLADPHPGLAAWGMAYGNIMQELYDFWDGKYKEEISKKRKED